MSTVKTNAILDVSGGNTATINSMTPTADSLQGFRNRIINGDMRIDQRNAGASVTPANSQYTLDRWFFTVTQSSKLTSQQSTTAPTGFVNSNLITSSSAYSVLTGDTFIFRQYIEGFNVADLGWGTANAKTVTLSFWVRSSLTGTFGGALTNASNRSYPFTYTINSANTWEQKSVTIVGDTTGTWPTNNTQGLDIRFGLGSGSTFTGTAGAWAAGNFVQPTGTVSVVGTNGATWYITGVQLEVGSVATPFERRDYGRELMLCQRYYYRMKANGADTVFANSFNDSTTLAHGYTSFPVTMRTAPTALEQNGTAGDYRVRYTGNNSNCSSVPGFWGADVFGATTTFTVASGLTAGQASFLRAVNSSAYLAWSVEL